MYLHSYPRRTASSSSLERDRPLGQKDALYYRLKATIDRAIRENITAPDWTANLQFVALVNRYNDAGSSQRAMMLILKRMLGGRSGWRRSNRVSWLVLLLLETCMKNCGPKFHFAAADDRLFQLMIRLAKPRITGKRSWGSSKSSGNFNRDLMEERVLVLIQAWGKAFGGATRGRMAIYNYYYQRLLSQGVKFPPSKPEDEVFAAHERSKSSSRPTTPRDKKSTMDSGKLKQTLAPMKEAVALLQEMLDALEPTENPDKDSVIVGLVEQLRQAKPRLITIIEECMDNEKLTEVLMSLFDTMDDLLDDYERRTGGSGGKSKAKSKAKPKSPRGKGGVQSPRPGALGNEPSKRQDEDSDESDEEGGTLLESFHYDPEEDEEELHRLQRGTSASAIVKTPPAAAAGLVPSTSTSTGPAPTPVPATVPVADPFAAQASGASPYRVIEPQRLQALYSLYPPFQQPGTGSFAYAPASTSASFSTGAPSYAYAFPGSVPVAQPTYGYPSTPAPVSTGVVYSTPTTSAQNPFLVAPSSAPAVTMQAAPATPTSSVTSPAHSDPLLDWLLAPAARQAAVAATTAQPVTSPRRASPRDAVPDASSGGSALGPPPSSHRARSRSRPVDN